MANVYDPTPYLRLTSTSGSENDVDEVFQMTGKGAVPDAGGYRMGYSQRNLIKCRSDHSRIVSGKDDLKSTGKASALSDSSNFVSRNEGGTGTLVGGPSKSAGGLGSADKIQNSSASDSDDTELASKRRSGSDSGDSDSILPEPEQSRELQKTNFSILYEQEEDTGFEIGAMNRVLREERERSLELPTESAGESTFVNEVHVEDDDDNLYPEIEHLPVGYNYCAYEDFNSLFTNESRHVIPSYAGSEGFPELPDDLLETKLDDCSPVFDLDEVKVPELGEFRYSYYSTR